jgi:hypothetical protein
MNIGLDRHCFVALVDFILAFGAFVPQPSSPLDKKNIHCELVKRVLRQVDPTKIDNVYIDDVLKEDAKADKNFKGISAYLSQALQDAS